MNPTTRKNSELEETGCDWISLMPKSWSIKKLKNFVVNRTEKNEKLDFHIDLENIEPETGRLIEAASKNGEEDDEEVAETQGLLFKQDDVLFGKLRPYLSKYYLSKKDGTCCTDYLVMHAESMDSRFFYSLVQTSAFVKYCVATSYGVKMPRTSWQFVREFSIPVPSKEEQTAIGEFVEQMNKQITDAKQQKQRQIELLQEHEKALIHQAVTKGLDRKAKMKDSGVEWIGKIPDGWRVRKVKNVLEINLGQSPEEELNVDGNGIPFYQGNANFGEKYPKPSTWCLTPKKIAEKGNILVSVRAPVGEVNICGEKSGIGRGLTALGSEHFEFYYYVFKVLNQELKKVSAGSTFDAIGYRELSQIKIPAPPTIEMTKITTYLDSETAKIHQAINNIQSQIEKLEEYRKSLIYEVVTGKVRVS